MTLRMRLEYLTAQVILVSSCHLICAAEKSPPQPYNIHTLALGSLYTFRKIGPNVNFTENTDSRTKSSKLPSLRGTEETIRVSLTCA